MISLNSGRLHRCAPLRTAPVLAVLLSLAASHAHARQLGSLEFEPCTLAPGFSAVAVEAQCATLAVPENRAEPDGRQISLSIAWVPARGDGLPDPVFMLAGGPGQAAQDAYPGLARAFDEVRKTRHVILVDQRGTGRSHPLMCRDEQGNPAMFDDETDMSSEATAAFAERCRDTLSADADLRFYSTGEAIDDLDSVRHALGAETINLVGISYGTRVAQQYAKRYPERTRTVLLDGVVPNDLVLGSEHARNLESALDMYFAKCREDALCRDKFGDPREQLQALLAIEQGPEVAFRHPTSGELTHEVFRRGHLVTVVRMFSYAPHMAALLPLSLSEAGAGRFEPLMGQFQLISGSLGEQIHHGMQLSVMCTEDVEELVEDPADDGTVLGNELIAFSKAQCAVWPKGERAADFRAPLSGSNPVLVISGELDPVTPPRYGEAVLSHLDNARHLVLRGQGHNVVGIGCMPRLMAQFFDKADPAALDATCLDGLRAAPPFVAFYGWEP